MVPFETCHTFLPIDQLQYGYRCGGSQLSRTKAAPTATSINFTKFDQRTRWFHTNMLVNNVCPMQFLSNAVRQRLGGRLDPEADVSVADIETLSIHCAKRDSKLLWIHILLRQLRNIIRIVTCSVPKNLRSQSSAIERNREELACI